MKITCIADLHGFYPKLDGGDLLIVAGDLTARDLPYERHRFLQWFFEQNYRKKIWIAGNHDNSLIGLKFTLTRLDSVEYLCDSGTEFEGLKIWGVPWTPRFIGMNPHCMAFTYDNETWFYDEKIMKIPHDIDILISHGPAKNCLDRTDEGKFVGSTAIEAYLKYVHRPKLHVFGHIHEAYGIEEKYAGYNDTMVKSINCSHVNADYKPVNAPINIEL